MFWCLLGRFFGLLIDFLGHFCVGGQKFFFRSLSRKIWKRLLQSYFEVLFAYFACLSSNCRYAVDQFRDLFGAYFVLFVSVLGTRECAPLNLGAYMWWLLGLHANPPTGRERFDVKIPTDRKPLPMHTCCFVLPPLRNVQWSRAPACFNSPVFLEF